MSTCFGRTRATCSLPRLGRPPHGALPDRRRPSPARRCGVLPLSAPLGRYQHFNSTREAFLAVDKDHSGTVSHEEFRQASARPSQPRPHRPPPAGPGRCARPPLTPAARLVVDASRPLHLIPSSLHPFIPPSRPPPSFPAGADQHGVPAERGGHRACGAALGPQRIRQDLLPGTFLPVPTRSYSQGGAREGGVVRKGRGACRQERGTAGDRREGRFPSSRAVALTPWPLSGARMPPAWTIPIPRSSWRPWRARSSTTTRRRSRRPPARTGCTRASRSTSSRTSTPCATHS